MSSSLEIHDISEFESKSRTGFSEEAKPETPGGVSGREAHDKDAVFQQAVNKAVEEIKPQILENLKDILPEIAEKIIREEIEKIKEL